MALVLADRVREGTNTAGTGTVTLTGAVTGFASFADQIGNGNTTYYTITDGTNWEVGVGTYNANTLSRDTVLDSSTGSLINFAAGFKDVFVTLPAEKVASTDTLGTMSTQNANAVAITGGTESGVTHSGDTIGTYLDYTSTSAPSYQEGRTWYDSTAKALAYYNDVSGVQIHVGHDLQFKVINNTGSTIPNGSPVYITGTSSGQTYPNVALAKADVAATATVIGLTDGAIANGNAGYVTSIGNIDNVNTSTFTVGQVLYLSPYSAGQLMNTIPPTGITVQVGMVTFVNSSTGKIYVKQTTPLSVPASIVTGQVAIANGGTGASTASGARTNLGLGTISTQDANAVAITGGTIDGATVGATTPAAGTFTTLTAQTEVLKGTGQNLVLQSQTFSNAVWTKYDVTVTANTVVAPDSTTTGSTITANGASNVHGLVFSNTYIPTGITKTTSIYAQKGTNNYLQIYYNGDTNPYANFDLNTGTVGTVGSSATATIVNVGSGWYRCILTTTSTTATNPVAILATSSSDTRAQSNTLTTYLYLWGAQVELGSTVNTYQVTTASPVYGTPTLSFSGVAGIGLQSDGSLYVQPAGTGALQAQATTSTATGGNARGANAVDWQTNRSIAGQVASSAYGTISGGSANQVTGAYGVVAGGVLNVAASSASFVGAGNSNYAGSNQYASIVGGFLNTSSGYCSFIGGGNSNTVSGYYNVLGGGFTNSATSGSAVTTQSGTMNGTTAVTLSGSNANIKVGQYITGTSIAGDTYVAAISGTSLTLSKNASGSSTSTLSFFTPHGVVVGGGNNQATGSYSFIGGGGDAGTAANRNVASGDWSTVSGGFKNVASGGYSTVAGGFTNTASGGYSGVTSGFANTASNTVSVVVGGEYNTANSQDSVVIGGKLGTTRSISGYTVFPASVNPLGFGVGYTQAAMLVLAKQTTDATASVLTSDGGAASGTNQVILPNNSAYYFKGTVVAGVTGGGNTKGWTVEGVIKRGANAGSTALVGTPTVTSSYADAGASTWTIAITADTTNGGLAVTFTGQAGTTIRAVAKIETTEMTY